MRLQQTRSLRRVFLCLKFVLLFILKRYRCHGSAFLLVVVMPWKDPLNNPALLALVVAAWAGAASILQRISRKKQPVTLVWVLGEILASTLAGMLAYWLYMSNPVDWMPVYVPVAVAGHMGGRFLQWVEEEVQSKFRMGAVQK